jgi:hypothetical protein
VRYLDLDGRAAGRICASREAVGGSGESGEIKSRGEGKGAGEEEPPARRK